MEEAFQTFGKNLFFGRRDTQAPQLYMFQCFNSPVDHETAGLAADEADELHGASQDCQSLIQLCLVMWLS